MEDREWLQYVQDMTAKRPEEHQITTTVTVPKKLNETECKYIQTIKLHPQE